MPADDYSIDSLLERLRRDGVRRTVSASRKPPIPSRLLQELADLDDAPLARQFVAAYPLSPSHLLENLALHISDPEVLGWLATNPRTPPHLLSELASHQDPRVRAQLATHPQLAARELAVLVQEADVSVRRATATSPSLRLPHHALLVNDEAPSVRLRLATHSALPVEAALILAADASTVVRAHTVATAVAPDDVLLGWAASDEVDLQLALATRANLPEAALRLLLLSPTADVRRLVRDQFTPDPVELLHLIGQGDEEERAWVAARPDLPPVLQRELAQDVSPVVLLALAGNPSLCADVADYFVAQAEEAICVALATNPALSSDHHQALAASRQPAVLTALAYQDDLDEELVPVLIEHSVDFRRHWALQNRPVTLTNPALARQIAADPLPTVRAFGVTAHAWRRAELYDFVRDPAEIVRLATVNHPNAADELLADALQDPSAAVVAAAQTRQTERLKAARAAALAPKPALPKVTPPTTPRSPSIPLNPPRRPAPTPGLLNQLKSIFWK